MRKPGLFRSAAPAVLAAAAGLLAGCGGMLYKPGTVAATPVEPPTGGLAGPEGRLAVGGGIELYWFAQGEGAPVLMVHGGPGYPFLESWAALAPLADRWRFIYYHQRGSGRSTRPIDRFESGDYYQNMLALDAALGLAAQLRDIESLRIASGAQRISLIGHSYGGFLAALYAAEYPSRVDKLILVAPAEVVRLPMKYSSGLFGAVEQALPENLRAEYADFIERYFDFGSIFKKSEAELQAQNHEFFRYYVAAYPVAAAAAAAAYYRADDLAGWGQAAVYFSLGQKYDLTAVIAGIAAPTLIITGEADLASEAEILDTYGRIPGARHIRLAAGHFAFSEDAAAFAQAVADGLVPAR